jgi:hypothetical protein
MYSTKPQEIFLKVAHGAGMQDKKPPGRFGVDLSGPQTAATDPETAKNPLENRPTHHGSETRQTAYVAGRVPLHIKIEVNRIGASKGWTESKTVKTLLEQALAHSLGEKFAVMIHNTIQEAVRTELQKDRAWLRNINVSEYLAAEQARLHAIDLHRLFIPPDQDINQKIKANRSQSFKHLPFYFRSIEVQDQQQSWPSSK